MSLYPSDLDYALAVDPQPDPDREAEDQRDARWATFTAALRARAQAMGWDTVIHDVGHAYWGDLCRRLHPGAIDLHPSPAFRDVILAFMETETWPRVLSAVAIAWREAEQLARESEVRR